MSAQTPRPNALPVDADAIAEALRSGHRWVCWDWRWNHKRSEWSKPPLVARTGASASATNPTTWCDLDTALNATRSRRWAGSKTVVSVD